MLRIRSARCTLARRKKAKEKGTSQSKAKGALAQPITYLHSSHPTLSAILTLFGIISAIYACFLFVSQKFENHINLRDGQFVGTWTNPSEGCIDCDLGNDAARPITLNLKVKDGELSGVLDASGWIKVAREEKEIKERKKRNVKKTRDEKILEGAMDMTFQFLSVGGDINGDHATLSISDMVGGEWKLFGKATLTVTGESQLRLEMKRPHFEGLPDNANLYRTLNDSGKACKKVDKISPWICNDPSED